MGLVMSIAAGIFPAEAASRKIRTGDIIPEFSVQTLSGDTYTFTGQDKKALVVVFLSAKQASSFKAQTDLVRVLSQPIESTQAMEIVIALDDPNAFSALTAVKHPESRRMVVTLDEGHHLWGHFRAIAMPTVIIADAEAKVVCFEAGYGFNFSRVVRSRMEQVLGAEADVSDVSLNKVTTVANSTHRAKILRLINAANMMARREHYDAAIVEMKKAQAMDPNAVEVRTNLGRLYCKANRAPEAIELLKDTTGVTPIEKAQMLTVTGRAYRLTRKLDEALKSLQLATQQVPNQAEALYELGQVYELKGLKDEALQAYRQALTLVF